MSITEHWDINRPIDKVGYMICDGCWKQVPNSDATGWVYFGFKHLRSQTLCTECQIEYKANFELLQNQGL